MGLLPSELEAHLPEPFTEPYRARQILSWMYDRGVTAFDEMTNLPLLLRREAAARFEPFALKLDRETESDNGDATKYLWALPDGQKIESVHLVLATRETFCISSQVGCAYGCTFCATARMGFRRHLSAHEIFEQVFHMRERLRQRQSGWAAPSFNIVFMGMGEPLANYERVVDAIRRITDPAGLNVSPRRITVSTVGLAERVRALAKEDLGVRLAISLNATTDALRLQTMPVTKKHSIDEVIDAAREFARETGNRVTLEYVLLRDQNDSLEDADRLRVISASLPCKINVIPWNPWPGGTHERPSVSWIETFLGHLMRGQAPAVTCRTTRGLDIAAACGQLAVSS
jgi:23S rRNA (adenine2503-C2)-methyltransferase